MKKIELHQIPLLNLRMEVSTYLGLFNNDVFCKQFTKPKHKNESINTPYESWYGRNQLFLTRILRTCILNVESAVCSCVYFEAMFRKILNDEIKSAVNNPFILGQGKGKGGGTAANFYNRLPSLIDEKIKLSNYDQTLWLKTENFYREIRNPISHGKELKNDDPSQIKESLDLILDLFNWIDSWFDLNKIIEGGKQLSEIPDFKDFIGQIVTPDYVPHNIPKSSNDIFEIPSVANVAGISIAEYLQFTLENTDNEFMNLRLSPKAAMKLLGYLLLAQKHTGWSLPDRL